MSCDRRLFTEVSSSCRPGRLIETVLRNDAVMIDEVGFASLDSTGSQLLFRFFAAANERRSLAIASHWLFEEWGRFLPEHSSVVSLLDRRLHHNNVVATDGEGYRMKEARSRCGFYWHLYLDGAIELLIKPQASSRPPPKTPTIQGRSMGQALNKDGLYGPIHQHIFNVRLDLEIDGASNSVVEVDTVVPEHNPTRRHVSPSSGC